MQAAQAALILPAILCLQQNETERQAQQHRSTTRKGKGQLTLYAVSD